MTLYLNAIKMLYNEGTFPYESQAYYEQLVYFYTVHSFFFSTRRMHNAYLEAEFFGLNQH
jgi:hypothetical protein